MRKVMSLRLSEEARVRLAELMDETGQSAGRVVEDLILGQVTGVEVQDISATKKVIGSPTESVRDAESAVADPPPGSGVTLDQVIPGVRPGTSSVLRRTIPKPPKAVKQESRRVNPMTGKPFGPVP